MRRCPAPHPQPGPAPGCVLSSCRFLTPVASRVASATSTHMRARHCCSYWFLRCLPCSSKCTRMPCLTCPGQPGLPQTSQQRARCRARKNSATLTRSASNAWRSPRWNFLPQRRSPQALTTTVSHHHQSRLRRQLLPAARCGHAAARRLHRPFAPSPAETAGSVARHA